MLRPGPMPVPLGLGAHARWRAFASVGAVIVLVLAIAAQRKLRGAAGTGPEIVLEADEGESDVSASGMPAADQVDFVIQRSWIRGLHARVYELEPPVQPLLTEGGASQLQEEPAGCLLRSDAGCLDGSANDFRRLLMPRRFEDVQMLRLLPLDSLRIELWPRRGPGASVLVRVLTDALSFAPNPRHSLWQRPKRHWLVLLEASVSIPKTAGLWSCQTAWKWARVAKDEDVSEDISEEPEETGNAEIDREIPPQVPVRGGELPFRVVELRCPVAEDSLGQFLSPRTRGGRSGGALARGGWAHLAFLMLLVTACIGQIALLLGCLAMLLIQVGNQRNLRLPQPPVRAVPVVPPAGGGDAAG
eukprot:TRINITY_DN41797_c0_g2_i1.p1 TRINITY_DN41797_c0_g2~~TRINITY_DN41797_c0_g2_i1.p1  ORF type:complete len:359 (+),score=58.09 TRINITY_DN41797_c0_g2_i1:197-1273(+)